MTTWDVYATLADAAGIDEAVYSHDRRAAAAGLPQPDSISQWDYITGVTTTPPRTIIVLGD